MFAVLKFAESKISKLIKIFLKLNKRFRIHVPPPKTSTWLKRQGGAA
jgi:hypothetical protein